MPRRIFPLLAGECYHIYNRGHNRQAIFFEQENYLFFLRRLRHHLTAKTSEVVRTSGSPETSEVYTASVIAYCLMPNHFHIVIQPHDDAFSHHWQMFTISYTKALNQRYGLTGAVFQGAFRAKHVERGTYLLQLTRYIHLNPVRAGLVKRPEDWPYSSYCDYIGLRTGTLPQTAIVLDQLQDLQNAAGSGSQSYREFVEAYLPIDEKEIAHLRFED